MDDDMIAVDVLNCGRVGVDPAVPGRTVSRSPVAYTGLFRSAKRRIWLPVKAFLIRHPKGNILVDTGWDTNVRRHPVRAISFPMWFASKPMLPDGEGVDEQLAKRGVSINDLHYVIMTHLDIDHASGLRLVKDAPHIMASGEEIVAIHSKQVRYGGSPWRYVSLEEVPYTEDPNAPFNRSWDVFGDGAVLVYDAPGHSQGSLVVKVVGEQGFVLIVGDSGYTPKSWQLGVLPGPVYNKTDMTKTLQWVRSQSELPDCRGILACHDATEKRQQVTLTP